MQPGAHSWSPVSISVPAGRVSPIGLRMLRLEHANLRAALEYCASATDGADAGLVMARKLDLYWSACGLLDEARHWLQVTLASGAGAPQERASPSPWPPGSPCFRTIGSGPGS